MSRYLTPFKICLLYLTLCYCDGEVPSDRLLDVMKFLAEQVLSQEKKLQAENEEGDSSAVELSAIIEVLNSPTSASASGRDSDSAEQWFLKRLNRAQTLDDLFDFFIIIGTVIVLPDERYGDDMSEFHEVILDETSLLGVFVRRCVLEWERMSFEDAVALWQQLEQYREPAALLESPTRDRNSFLGLRADWEAYNPTRLGQPTTGLTAVLERNAHDAKANAVKLGSYDVERLLQFQMDKMSKSGVRLPQQVVKHFESLARRSRDAVHLLSYAKFLDAWASGDFTSAFENLHQFYDYSTRNNDRTQYQYALLQMAVLHADFGSDDEAISAMNETISIARENKDMACLSFCLSWVFNFRKSRIQSKNIRESDNPWFQADDEALEFLKYKAAEEKMFDIMSSAIISQAQLSLSKGGGPDIAFRRSYESSFLNLTHGLDFIRPEQLLLHSRLMLQLGDYALSNSYKRLVIDCYGESSHLLATAKAKCELMISYSNAGDLKAAEKIAEELSSRIFQNQKVSQLVSDHLRHYRAKRAIHQGNLDEAELIIEELQVRSAKDPSLHFEVARLYIFYYLGRHDFSAALKKANDTLLVLEEMENGSVEDRLRLLISKANVFAACDRAQKGTTLAMRAAATARAIKHMPIYWEACSILAKSLNAIGEFQAAKELLESVIYQAELAQDAILMAEMASSCADACVGQAGKSRSNEEQKRQYLNSALPWLQKSLIWYEKLGDVEGKVEMYQKFSMVYRHLGNTVELEKAKKCLKDALTNKSSTTV